MYILESFKSMFYYKQIADLEYKLLELQSINNKLIEENSTLKHNETTLVDRINLLEDRIEKLNITNSSNNKYILQIQNAFKSKIDELKKTSDNFFAF